MVFKNFESKLIFRVVLLLLTLSLPALFWINGWAELLVFLVPLIIFQVIDLIRFQNQLQEDLNLFMEAIRYRDFSRFFNEKNESEEVQTLRKAFNEINTTFRVINREKEIQHQHLQKILALVNTGIITFDIDSGEVLLMNEAFKNLLHVPFMNNIVSLAKREQALFSEVQQLQPGQSKIVTIRTGQQEQDAIKVLLAASVFQSDEKNYKLVALQNVNEALDETEAKAWEKLLNVLTHEIMNSVAPISSLAETLKNRLQEIEITEVSRQDIEDLEEGVGTIKHRSEGLLRFAETYRNLSKITRLNVEKVRLKEVFGNLKRLMQPTLTQKGITLQIQLRNPETELQADPDLLDQVLINLLVNAIDAVKDKPEPTIILSAVISDDNKVVIKVADNGTGMTKELEENIFIPFFSTKKRGSGIGLSLCKQIVLLHGGSIQVKSEPGEGTVFTLQFSYKADN